MMKINSKNNLKDSLRHNTLKAFAMTCGLLLCMTAQAANNDFEQEITIKSQRQSADLKNKIASYLDNVSIRQGSISITADIVNVFSTVNKENGEKTDTYSAKGKPAIFQQKLEDGNVIQLQGDQITYTPLYNTITVSGNALVKQAGSEVSGNEITYNTLSKILEANSIDNQSVTTILQPTTLKQQKENHQKSKAEKEAKAMIKEEGNSHDN